MSIDRRILAILYFNNINDVNQVQKFLGPNGDYYEVMIDGELKKLKFPDKEYTEDTNIFETIKEKIEEFVKDVVEEVKEDVVEFVDKVEDEIKKDVAEIEKTVEEDIQIIKDGATEIKGEFDLIAEEVKDIKETVKDVIKKIEDNTVIENPVSADEQLDKVVEASKADKDLFQVTAETFVKNVEEPKKKAKVVKKSKNNDDDFISSI
jgi:dGTP triphosphohydrolase